MNIAVTPSPYVKPTLNVTNVNIRVMNVVLFDSVNINVTLLSDTTFLDSKLFSLKGEDYKKWGSDDTYIVSYVLTQLGLTQLQADQVATT